MTTGENTSENADILSANACMHIKYNYISNAIYIYTTHTHTLCLKHTMYRICTFHPNSQGLAALHVALTDCLIGIGVPDKAHGVVSPRICRTQAF